MPVSLDKIKEKRDKVGELVAQADALLTERDAKATEDREARSKGTTPKHEARIKELSDQFEAIHRDVEELSAQIQLEEKQYDAAAALASRAKETEPLLAGRQDSDPNANRAGDDPDPTKEEVQRRRKEARVTYYRKGFSGLNAEQRAQISTVTSNDLPPEARAQAMGTDTAGGILVGTGDTLPMVEALTQFGWFMNAPVTMVRTADQKEIPLPTNNDTGNKGRRIGENVAAAETNLTVGAVRIGAYMYTSDYILVPYALLNSTDFELEGFIQRKMGERNGRILADEFTTFSGTSGPEGIVTGATLGKTGAAGQTTSITTSDFYALKHSVDPAYRFDPRWMFSDDTLLKTKQLKSGDGVPLWQPGLANREPNTIDGDQYIVNQSMADMAASAKSVLYGAFQNYYVREVTQRVILRLTERFAEYGQVAFLMFSWWDAKLVDAGTNPVKYYQNAAA